MLVYWIPLCCDDGYNGVFFCLHRTGSNLRIYIAAIPFSADEMIFMIVARIRRWGGPENSHHLDRSMGDKLGLVLASGNRLSHTLITMKTVANTLFNSKRYLYIQGVDMTKVQIS